jgi:hypothetical protein
LVAQKLNFLTVSVGVVCMSDTQHLTRCLHALRSQRDAPEFEITVACDPRIPDIETVRGSFPETRIVVNAGQRTPLELASLALRECRGELILLTKDHCVPGPDWVRTMVNAQASDRSVVGGRVEPARDASAADWAFFFIDYYRYTSPVAAGWTSSLTACNVSYDRGRLEAVRSVWQDTFVETAVNNALAARFGGLWLEAASEVTTHRKLTLREAVRERYIFGRLFGYSRLAGANLGRRLFYAAFTPALPLLLLARLTRTALRSRRHATALMRAWLPLALMVLGRSMGEWLGYITARPPRTDVWLH